MIQRRAFFRTIGTSIGVTALAASRVRAQDEAPATMADMNQNAYRPVKLEAKPGARPLLTDDQRDELEHHLHCQCGCDHDIYTCRTTDFSCSVCPPMHFDVMGLVSGGYSEQEIMAAFRQVYGERVLMAPVKEGFNWVGYILPFAAIITGGGVILTLLKRWTRPGGDVAPILVASDATPAEMERLRNALRSDE